MPREKGKIGWDETEPYHPGGAVVVTDTKDPTLAPIIIMRTATGGLAAHYVNGNQAASFQVGQGLKQTLLNPNDSERLVSATSTQSGLEVSINRDRATISPVGRFEDFRWVTLDSNGNEVAYVYTLGGSENEPNHGYKGWMQVDIVPGLTINVGATTNITFERGKLYIDQPNTKVYPYEMAEDTIYTIGRARSNSIQTPPQITVTSNIHCTLIKSGGKLFIFDDKSTNGTLIITPIPLQLR